MLKLNGLSGNLLDDQDYLSEFFTSSYNTHADCASALCLFSNLLDFLFKSLKQSLSNFSWEIGEEVRRKHFSLGVVLVTGCCLT